MKKILAFMFLLTMAIACKAAAVWDLELRGTFEDRAPFGLSGTFTTDSSNLTNPQLITSFTGTWTDGLNHAQPIELVPTGETICASSDCGMVFDYNNLLYEVPGAGWTIDDAFNYQGLMLFAPTSGSYVNIYSGPTLLAYDCDGPGQCPNSQVTAVTGTLTLETAAVPEPRGFALLLAGLALVACLRRRRF